MKRDELEMRLIGLEAKVDALFQLIGTGGAGGSRGGDDDAEAVGALSKLTKKQHQTLQMLIRGGSNDDVAKKLGCSVNTAKVHVRTIASKFGVNKRGQIAMMGKGMIDGVSDEVYQNLAGVPKSWANDV
jgi:DNA-binding CsgD family transcriptional regulator